MPEFIPHPIRKTPEYVPHQIRKTSLEANGYVFQEWRNELDDSLAVDVLWGGFSHRGEAAGNAAVVGRYTSYSEFEVWYMALRHAEEDWHRRTWVPSIGELIARVL